MRRTRVRPFPVLFAAFLIIPIIEIFLLIQVGSLIGALPTIGLVVLTAVLG
ncbi:MAG: FxsA family protein, partial [Gammaproteobacteria bacterium]|nr:FxsA family protein [Gammaproteobacteria bacterium]